MEDIEILKKVLEQEIKAEKRYAAQINSIRKAEIIRKVLNDIKREEIKHINQTIEKIKQIDPNFKEITQLSEIKIEYEGTDNIEQIKKLLEIDIEKEKLAYKNYMSLYEETNNLDIKKMLSIFIEEEKQHKTRILNLIDNLSRLG